MESDLNPKPAADATVRRNAEAEAELDHRAETDLAGRGLIARPSSPQVDHAGGWSVWDLDAFAFLDGDAPPEVHPSLWRQARRNMEAGLFEVAPGFWQVRGLDLANLTVIDGEEGRIVIDPLTSAQTAAAALALVDEHLGPRPVTAVIYTHSHIDHFGGVRGVVDEADVIAGRIPVIAPAGFLAAAVSENVVAGVAMTRRASYMYGSLLPKGPRGHVDAGLGKGVPLLADQGLIAPTVDISETGTEMIVDGVRIVFQVTPDTEAPAEMNFHFPDHRVLCMAENCTCTLHNVYTPRGAPVRDALAWSRYLQEAIDVFVPDTDVMFATHHWPRWGCDEIGSHLANQRDAYRFIHDQTLRLANHGATSREIAEELRLPEALESDAALRGYYGTVSHNVKAVYQRYLGWFDGNPANLEPHPPAEAGKRYVQAMGGGGAVMAAAEASFAEGDYRWVAELLGHLVFSEPDRMDARALQADALEQLGYQSESAPWRDFYLTGAQELRHGTLPPRPGSGPAAETVAAMTTEQLIDSLGVRIDGPAAADREWSIDVTITDRDERWRIGIRNGAIHATAVPVTAAGVDGGDDGGAGLAATSASARPADGPPRRASIEATHAGVGSLVFGSAELEDLEANGSVVLLSGRNELVELLGVLDSFSLMFPIVTP